MEEVQVQRGEDTIIVKVFTEKITGEDQREFFKLLGALPTSADGPESFFSFMWESIEKFSDMKDGNALPVVERNKVWQKIVTVLNPLSGAGFTKG